METPEVYATTRRDARAPEGLSHGDSGAALRRTRRGGAVRPMRGTREALALRGHKVDQPTGVTVLVSLDIDTMTHWVR